MAPDGSTDETEKGDDVKHLLSAGNGRVRVRVCTCCRKDNVRGLISFIQEHMDDVVSEVIFRELPFNLGEIDRVALNNIDVLLLCHSVDSRGFRITNVQDALYDQLLYRARKYLGRSKVGLIVNDLTNKGLEASFKEDQPNAFRDSAIVLTCGSLEKSSLGLDDDQKEKLREFLQKASSPPLREKIGVNLHRLYRVCCCKYCRPSVNMSLSSME